MKENINFALTLNEDCKDYYQGFIANVCPVPLGYLASTPNSVGMNTEVTRKNTQGSLAQSPQNPRMPTCKVRPLADATPPIGFVMLQSESGSGVISPVVMYLRSAHPATLPIL